jgi:hypothetical protein
MAWDARSLLDHEYEGDRRRRRGRKVQGDPAQWRKVHVFTRLAPRRSVCRHLPLLPRPRSSAPPPRRRLLRHRVPRTVQEHGTTQPERPKGRAQIGALSCERATAAPLTTHGARRRRLKRTACGSRSSAAARTARTAPLQRHRGTRKRSAASQCKEASNMQGWNHGVEPCENSSLKDNFTQ